MLNLSEKGQGWLHYLWRKATTEDDWSKNGKPHPWWDSYSFPPMLNFARFDLSESSYGLLVMARKTPAWREVYGRILDELVRRHTTYWAAIDWLTQFGPDPDRARYPKAYKRLIPKHLWGNYDTPGWVANGIAPWPLSPDPIGSAGNLFFRGFFNLILAIHRDVTGSDKWNHPFAVTGLDDRTFDWTHDGINQFLSDQWANVWHGPHCENTKVWPFCLSAAGLGLQLSDNTLGTQRHWVFDRWTEEFLTKKCMGYDSRGRLKWVGLYYDPLIDFVQGQSALSGLFPAFYVLPQDRALAERMYRKAIAAIGWDKAWLPMMAPASQPRAVTIAYLLAREFGDETTMRRTRKALAKFSNGRFFDAGGGNDLDDFGYFFRFEDAFPRGQESALLMLADIMDGGEWFDAFKPRDRLRFTAPTVEGVDFPNVGVSVAYNDERSSVLNVCTYAATKSRRGEPTRFRITQLPNPGTASVRRDGEAYGAWRVVGANEIEIDAMTDTHQFEIQTGYRGSGERLVTTTRVVTDEPRRPTSPIEIFSATRAVAAGVAACPCCA